MKNLILGLVVIGSLFFANTATAGRCISSVIAKEIVTPVVVTVPVPVIVPAFQYQYAPACAVAAPTYAGYPISGHPAIPQQAPLGNGQDKIRELAKALLEEIARQHQPGGDSGPPMAVMPSQMNSYPQIQPTPMNRTNPQSPIDQNAIKS